MSKLLRILSGVLAMSLAACVETSKPATLPKIDFEKLTLANGLDVILHVDEKMPAVNVNLWYHVGSKDEAPGRTGFAHLFEHMMFQGSKHAPGEFLTLIERAGANLRAGGVNGTTSTDRTNYFATVPSSALEYALWLESDRMGFLLEQVDQAALDNQRDVVMNEKRQGDNRPYAMLKYIVAEQMYPVGHPYAHTVIGSMEDLAAATLDDVRSFFRKYYAPNNASLTLSGNFDKEQAKILVQRYFGSLPPGEPLTRLKAQVPTLDGNRLVIQEERVPAPKLTLVWHAAPFFDVDEASLDFVARILGDSQKGRLYRRLVREDKVATRVAAYNDANELAGLFYIDVLLSPDASLADVKARVLEEVRRLAEEGPRDEELKQQKAAREFEFISALERIGGFGGKADRLNLYNTFLGDPGAFERDFERYQTVTRHDVRRAAKSWLSERHYLEVRFQPKTLSRADQPEPDRSVPPSLAGRVPFAIPKVETTTLENGLTLYVASRPELPKVEATLFIKHGDLTETENNAGLSHMTTATLTEGTKTRTAEQIQDVLADLGAELTAEGGKLGAAVSLAVLKQHLDAGLNILADVTLRPSFPDAEVALAKKLKLEQIVQEMNNPHTLANELFPRLLYPNHPLGVAARGTSTSIQALTRDALVSLHATYFVPSNAALLLAGDIAMDEAKAIAAKHFGSWQGKAPPAPALPLVTAPDKRRVYLVDAPGAAQSQIRIGSLAPRRGADEQVAVEVANAMLGGTFSSRLNLNLREDKGYSYGAFSGLTMSAHHGYWQAAAGVQTPATGPALIEFRKEVEGLGGAIPITEEELSGFKSTLSRSYLQNFETLSQLQKQVAPLIIADVPLGFLDTYVPLVLKETPASIAQTAQRHFDMERVVVLVVGDLAVIEAPIRALNWGEVMVLDREGRPKS